jgi:uncharacterized protein (DUF2126 family)
MTKPWAASIPQIPKRRDRKRCYTVWEVSKYWRTGGKVVWLTDRQLTFARIKYPRKEFDEVLERDTLEECKKYMGQTID